MASTPELIESRVGKNPEYIKAFRKVFGEDEITFDNITKAIAAYEKILVTRSSYDEFLEGNETALTKEEKRGLNLFIDMGCKPVILSLLLVDKRFKSFRYERITVLLI